MLLIILKTERENHITASLYKKNRLILFKIVRFEKFTHYEGLKDPQFDIFSYPLQNDW